MDYISDIPRMVRSQVNKGERDMVTSERYLRAVLAIYAALEAMGKTWIFI